MNLVGYYKKHELAVKKKVLTLAMGGTFILMSAGTGSAALADDLSNLSTVITSATGWVTDIMAVFMEPPLVIFVGIGVLGIVINKVRKLIRTR